MKRTVPACAPALLAICAALLMLSCRHSGQADMKAATTKSKSATGKQWRLAADTIAADGIESYNAGLHALRTLDAFGAVALTQLFYHQKLIMMSAGTLVAAAGGTASAAPSAIEVRVLDGPQSGKTLWLYPESAKKMGFRPPRQPSG